MMSWKELGRHVAVVWVPCMPCCTACWDLPPLPPPPYRAPILTMLHCADYPDATSMLEAYQAGIPSFYPSVELLLQWEKVGLFDFILACV